jgi:hypothetical protein
VNEDPLLSANAVARLYGTGICIVTDLVAEGKLPTLDQGGLIAAGHLDVPLIRASWARALQRASPGAARIVRPPSGELLHPAVLAAANFHEALQVRDAAIAYEHSSAASRRGRSPRELLDRWLELLGQPPEDSGIGSVIYSLAPLPALGARVFAEAPKLPRAVEGPTPASALAVLPVIEENRSWRVDLGLFEEHAGELLELLNQPPPDDSEGSGAADAES